MKKIESQTLIAELVCEVFFSYLAKRRIKEHLSDYDPVTDDAEIDSFILEKNELFVKYSSRIHAVITSKYSGDDDDK